MKEDDAVVEGAFVVKCAAGIICDGTRLVVKCTTGIICDGTRIVERTFIVECAGVCDGTCICDGAVESGADDARVGKETVIVDGSIGVDGAGIGKCAIIGKGTAEIVESAVVSKGTKVVECTFVVNGTTRIICDSTGINQYNTSINYQSISRTN